MSRYDNVLQKLLAKPSGSIKYLSPTVQNEFINMIGKDVENKIFDEIRSAPFFSLILDTTQDISKIEQLSVTFRYVVLKKNKNNEIIQVECKESFTGFYPIVHDRSAEGLKKLYCEFI